MSSYFFLHHGGIANSKTSKILLHAATESDISSKKSRLHSFANALSFTKSSDLVIVSTCCSIDSLTV
ncbi:hypothetical protein TL16_g05838 [Triparma laevis f. inornata]|uniref:Uncharacterized protein n=1 Tax=Triparma laevis f. inornata TaxID=1714386 RepID=A0A9W7AMN0_9STRA|nr:hypothetical protein TL16_g05838 [Triparma laevis f. inornata]